MKKITTTLIMFLTFLTAQNLLAQACLGGSNPSVCTPMGGPSAGGFDDSNITPCVEQGVAYSHAIQFSMFSVFEFLGTQDVDSIQFVSIDNLPCGLCWAVNQADKTYSAGEDGCLSITGTTNDAAGQYKMALTLKAWINGQANAQTIPPTLVDQTGVKILVRVKTQGGSCAAADTTSGANNLNATTGCPVGINDLEARFSSFFVSPNPMSSGLHVTFTVKDNASYSLQIMDVAGKIISTKQVEAKQGFNSVFIPRESMQSGVYFLSLTDGTSALTRRFSVID